MSAELIERFADHQRYRGFSHRTVDRRTWSLSKFVRHLGGVGILDAGRDEVEEFLAGYRAAQTRYSMRADLAAFYRWAVRRDLLDANPCDKVEPPRLLSRAATPLTHDDLERAIVAATPVTRLCILLGAYAGLRVSEIAALRFEDVRADEGTIVVRGGKGGKDRIVPLAQRVADELGIAGVDHAERARRDLDECLAIVAGGSFTGATPLSVFLDQWCAHGIDALDIAAATKANYRLIVANLITPTIGALRLDQVDDTTADELERGLVDRGYKPGSIRVARGVLRRALRTVHLGEHIDRRRATLPATGPIVGTTGGSIGNRIRQLFRSLDIDARPHDLRHTFGTEAARASNGNVVLVAQLMGHSSIQTTQRYIGWTPAGADVVAALFPSFAGAPDARRGETD